MAVAGEITLFFTAFALITLAEMGDKTQFSVITLAAKYPPLSVASGSILAFALVNGIAVIAGALIVAAVPVFWVKLAASFLFLAFGAYTLYGLRETEGEAPLPSTDKTAEKSGFASSFSLIFLMELGDKTQIATATIVAGYGHPFVVFAGVVFGLSLLTVLEVKLGSAISERVPRKKMELAAGLLFILFGAIMLVEAIAL